MKRQILYYNPEEIKAIYNQLEGKARLMFYTSYVYGANASELSRIKITDITWNTIKIADRVYELSTNLHRLILMNCGEEYLFEGSVTKKQYNVSTIQKYVQKHIKPHYQGSLKQMKQIRAIHLYLMGVSPKNIRRALRTKHNDYLKHVPAKATILLPS